MAYLKRVSLPYSSYYYWKRKFCEESVGVDSPAVIAPISVRNAPTISSLPREGISVSTPDGLLVHFSPGMEDAAMRFLLWRGGSHV